MGCCRTLRASTPWARPFLHASRVADPSSGGRRGPVTVPSRRAASCPDFICVPHVGSGLGPEPRGRPRGTPPSLLQSPRRPAARTTPARPPPRPRGLARAALGLQSPLRCHCLGPLFPWVHSCPCRRGPGPGQLGSEPDRSLPRVAHVASEVSLLARIGVASAPSLPASSRHGQGPCSAGGCSHVTVTPGLGVWGSPRICSQGPRGWVQGRPAVNPGGRGHSAGSERR